MSLFKKAVRSQAKLKIAITGPSGSGKTYSALEIASGISKKIALVDTENSSASLYADRFEFDTLTIEPPYTVAKYNQAIDAAAKAGYDVLVIDSISHAWAGDGGLLSKKEALDSRGGNSYTNWASLSKEHENFKANILNAPLHLICTMRSKQDYVLDVNDKGKSAPRKVGLAPIQRDGMEYEFTTVFDVGMSHEAAVSKDRTGLFDGMIEKLSVKTGEKLMAWLHSAAPAEVKPIEPEKTVTVIKPRAEGEAPPATQGTGPTEKQLKRMFAIMHNCQISEEVLKQHMFDQFAVTSSKDLTQTQYQSICNDMEAGKIGVENQAVGS